eukprot:gene5337-7406_t
MVEMRIFIPFPKEEDREWMNPMDKTSYDASFLYLLSIHNNNSHRCEVRTDDYVCGSAYYGLKVRNGKKLELKVRVNGHDFKSHMETWKKYKLSKKKVHKCKDEILGILVNHGYDDVNLETSVLDKCLFLPVQKSRFCWMERDISAEICRIQVPISTCHRQEWLSIAIEGTPDKVLEYILYKHHTSNFWNAIKICLNVSKADLDASHRTMFIPIVSGYPQWVRLTSEQMDSNELITSVLPRSEYFVDSLI